MNKFYLFTLCLLAKLLDAQTPITINALDMPVNGDTLRYSNAATTGLVPATILSNTGANYNWNYSSLVPTDQLLESFKSSASTPYLLYFAGMIGYKRADSINLGPITQKNVWDFYKNSATKFDLEGTGFTLNGIPLASNYTDPDELYYFPLNYNDLDSGTFSVTTTIPTFGSYVQAGKRKNSVDGWGKITTPFGTFDALRMVSVITETDTIKLTSPFPLTLPIPNNRIEFKWLSKGVHIPMLEIIVSVGATGTQITSVKYRDQYHFIQLAPTANFIADNVFPKINNIVKLTDLSTDNPTRWKWTITPNTFTLANSTIDTAKNIDVKFTANGNYTVALRVQNNAGLNTMTKTAYIKVGDAPAVKFGADKLTANMLDLVTLTDSSTNSPSRWKWTILPTTYSFNTGSVDTLKSVGVKFSKGGFYSVDLKVTNSWGYDEATKSNYIWINFPAGINKSSSLPLQIFPNPVKDELQFTLDNINDITVLIYNYYGALVYSGSAYNNSISVKDLANGIYIIEFKNGSENLRARFVKE